MVGTRNLGLLLAAASAVIAHPSAFRRQDSRASVHVTGVTGPSGLRQEVHTLREDTASWNLYLLALERFKNMLGSDPMSWYQIAGIHGQPYVIYQDVLPCSNCTMAGYCTHQSTLFAPWHRTYLALFEQSLINNAIEVANEFSGDDRIMYLEKAQSLRMPFWDWALEVGSDQEPFPLIFTWETVQVSRPNGTFQIENPLLRYHFKVDQDHSFIGSDVTYRNSSFTIGSRMQLRTGLWTLLSSQQHFDAFSTESLLPGVNNYNPTSLEALHDHVHIMSGGQMAIVPQAAFDPVFWLHHANVDRIFALWQEAHPDDYMQSWSEVGSTMTYAMGAVENASSDLTPFHSSTNGTFYSPNDVRELTVFNYGYADLTSGKSAARIINSLYRDSQPALAKRSASHGQPGHIADYINKVLDPNAGTKVDEYIANIEVDSQGMNGSFQVFLFSGPFDESNAGNFHNEKNLIGSHGFFSTPHAHGNGANRVNAGISLTGSLIAKLNSGVLANLDSTAVTQYLKDNIEWRIVKTDGTVLDEDDVCGLVITILTSKVELPGDGSIARWGDFTAMPDVTSGRRAGFTGEWNSKWHSR